MSSSRRSSHRQHPAKPSQLDQLKAVLGAVKYLASGKWLAGLSGIDRALSRKQKKISEAIIPKQVRKSAEAIGEKVKQAEKSVKNTGRQLGKTVAESSVGKSAGELARRGKSLESKAGRFLLKAIAEFFASIIPKPIQDRLKAVGRSFRRVFSVLFVFLGRWAKTRTYWHLIGGIPAFMMALPLAYCMVRIPFYDNAAKARHYQNALWAAPLDAHELRLLYRRKLDQLGGASERVQLVDIINRYDQAVEIYDKAAEQAALQDARKLAPKPPDDAVFEDGVLKLANGKQFDAGFPDAHAWLARRYFLQAEEAQKAEQKELAREAYGQAEREIGAALSRDPANIAANALRVSVFSELYAHDPTRMKSVAESLDRLRQQTYLQTFYRARSQYSQGKEEESIATLRGLAERLLLAYQDGSLLLPQYELLATTLFMLGDARQSEAVLLQGIDQADDSERTQRVLIQTLVRQCKTIAQAFRAGGIYPEENLRLAELAWSLNRNDEWPLIHISALANLESATGQAARETAERILQEDENSLPKSYLTIFGTAAAERGDFQQAAKFLQRAYELNRDAQSANNLAWVLLKQRQGLQQALEVANFAVQGAAADPKIVPIYRETRGQIYLALGNHPAAIEDLEFALNGIPAEERGPIHGALAQAYQAVGMADLAAAHRSRAGESAETP